MILNDRGQDKMSCFDTCVPDIGQCPMSGSHFHFCIHAQLHKVQKQRSYCDVGGFL